MVLLNSVGLVFDKACINIRRRLAGSVVYIVVPSVYMEFDREQRDKLHT